MTSEPNLRIWSQVEKTNPAHTKHVNQRGGFTAISAAYQIMRATEVFGPIGQGWGYDAAPPLFHGDLVFVPVTLWHSGDRTAVFGPMFGGAEVKDQKGRLDSDALKKATTDALTKLLSQLGFNADVFLGRFDDNKYVAELRNEFAEENRSPSTAPPADSGPSAEETAINLLRGASADKALFTETWEKNKDGWKQVLDPKAYANVWAVMRQCAKAISEREKAETDTFRSGNTGGVPGNNGDDQANPFAGAH